MNGNSSFSHSYVSAAVCFPEAPPGAVPFPGAAFLVVLSCFACNPVETVSKGLELYWIHIECTTLCSEIAEIQAAADLGIYKLKSKQK